MEREGGHREYLLVLVDEESRLSGLLRRGCAQFLKSRADGREIGIVEGIKMHGRSEACREADFLCRYRAEAHAGCEQGLIKARPFRCADARDDGGKVIGEEVELVLAGRQLVTLARQHRADAAVVVADLAQCVEDEAILHEDDVAVFAHEFEYERLRDDAAAGGERIDVDEQQAVEAVLADAGDAARLELLAQHHAEDRGLWRILEILLEQVSRRILWLDGDMEQVIPAGLAHGQDD